MIVQQGVDHEQQGCTQCQNALSLINQSKEMRIAEISRLQCEIRVSWRVHFPRSSECNDQNNSFLAVDTTSFTIMHSSLNWNILAGHWTIRLGRQSGRLLHWPECSCVSTKTKLWKLLLRSSVCMPRLIWGIINCFFMNWLFLNCFFFVHAGLSEVVLNH